MSLKLDSNDNPFIAYMVRTQGQTQVYETVKFAFWGQDHWNNFIMEEAETSLSINPKLVIDGNNTVMMAYRYSNWGQSEIRFCEWNGIDWNKNTVFLGVGTMLQLNLLNDNPTIAFKYPDMIKYAEWDGNNWLFTDFESPYFGGFIDYNLSLTSNGEKIFLLTKDGPSPGKKDILIGSPIP